MLSVSHLTKRYKKTEAVKDACFELTDGTVTVLLGPNGAGKSTLLKSLTGIMRQTEGEILFDGHRWSRKDLNEIGAMVETPPIYENLSA